MDNRAKILDIAMNLNRVGNWAADGYKVKQKRIKLFLDQNKNLLKSLTVASFPPRFAKTLSQFLQEYPSLERAGIKGPDDELLWAEKMMTWGNILTHRSRLITSS